MSNPPPTPLVTSLPSPPPIPPSSASRPLAPRARPSLRRKPPRRARRRYRTSFEGRSTESRSIRGRTGRRLRRFILLPFPIQASLLLAVLSLLTRFSLSVRFLAEHQRSIGRRRRDRRRFVRPTLAYLVRRSSGVGHRSEEGDSGEGERVNTVLSPSRSPLCPLSLSSHLPPTLDSTPSFYFLLHPTHTRTPLHPLL